MEIKFSKTPHINFKAMKSSQFKSLEYSAMRRFKAPIEKFKTMQDFYAWSAQKCTDLAQAELGGRDSVVQLKRQTMRKDWIEYLTSLENITMPVILLTISSLLKGLKDNNSDLLPQLDKDVFQKTLELTKSKVNSDREYQFDLKKAYIENLRQKILGGKDAWIIIPSKKTDEMKYQANLEKLKTLSPRTWCTKNDKAEDYLEHCDIHIYYENGSPELGIRIKDGKVYDIVGFENNGKIPQKYLTIVKSYIQTQNLKLGLEAKDQIESAENLNQTITSVRNEIGSAIETNDVFRIMEYFGYKPEILEDGSISIIGFMQPPQGKFSELGINENKLFEKISEIRTNASFRNCSASSLGIIKRIGGMANFNESSILDASKLEEVGGDLYLSGSKIKTLPSLKKVGGIIVSKNSALDENSLKINPQEK